MRGPDRRCPACRTGECRYCAGGTETRVPGMSVPAVPRSCWCDHSRQAVPHDDPPPAAGVLMEPVRVTACSVRVGDVLLLDGHEHVVRDLLAVATGRKNLIFEDGAVHGLGMTPVPAYRQPSLVGRSGS